MGSQCRGCVATKNQGGGGVVEKNALLGERQAMCISGDLYVQ